MIKESVMQRLRAILLILIILCTAVIASDSNYVKVLQDLEHQYILCYKSPVHKKPGEFHTIKVECKKDGVQLRYRKNYLD